MLGLVRFLHFFARSRSNMGLRSAVSAFLAPIFFSVFPAAPANFRSLDIEKSRIIDKVVCARDSQFSYALFLPSSYSSEKAWPVIICFDPRAQGRRPVEKLQAAAETYGYIVAGSLDSKNGPLEPIQKAAKAVWLDMRQRFSIDPARIYAAGFSGGAEAAALLPYFIETRAAGIISCGAGLPSRFEPERVKPAAYYGIIGNWDFRYLDMARLEEEFDRVDVTHRIVCFEGWHQWPSPELLVEAVKWMDLMAMKAGLKEKDNGWIESEYQKRLKAAADLESSGHMLSAVREYESLASDFKGWIDVADVEKRISVLKSSTDFQKLEKDKQAAEKNERSALKRVLRAFAAIDQPAPDQPPLRLKDVVREMDLDALVSGSVQTKNLFQSDAAKRVLAQVAVTADERGFRAREAGNHRRAILFFELAARASVGHPMNPGEYYNLACAYALSGEDKAALKALRLAVEKGFDDIELLESDKDLDSLRGTREFVAIVEELKSRRVSQLL